MTITTVADARGTVTTEVEPLAPTDGDGTSTTWRQRVTRAAALRWLGDLASLALLFGILVYLTEHDGGRLPPDILPVAILALVALPAAASEVRRLSAPAFVTLAAWTTGGALALLLAVERSQFVQPVLTIGIMPVVLLATSRVWRRRWGPGAVLGLLGIAFGRYWYRSFLQWWGGTMRADRQLQWLSLSWHNQSGALMGSFALIFAGTCFTTRRVVSWGMALLASGALTGMWLSGSRAVVLLTLLGLGVTAAAAVVRTASVNGWRQVAMRLGAVLVGAVVIVGVLTGMRGSGSGQPIGERRQAATANLLARLDHMQAAAGMALDNPLTGAGPGSYTIMARSHTPPDANLTASAHNEYLENFAEGGLLLGLAGLGLGLGLAVLIARSLRADAPEDPHDLSDIRSPLTVGAVGVATLLISHAAIDFDWDYLVLGGLLAMAAAMLLAARDRIGPPRSWWRATAVVPAAALIAAGIAGQAVERDSSDRQEGLSPEEFARAAPPWDHPRVLGAALQLAEDGEITAARVAVDRTRRWNPGVENVETTAAVVAFEAGEISPTALAGTLPDDSVWFRSWLTVADALARNGHEQLAVDVVDDMLERIAVYRPWGTRRTEADGWLSKLRLLTQLGDCQAVAATAEEALATPLARDDAQAREAIRQAAAACD